MSDAIVDGETKPTKEPSLISLSFGGFNSLAIVTSSISILRLITAHSTVTLHGIVADVVDWYKKFFHQSFDAAIEWANAHIHWLHLPHISDNVKDVIILYTLSVLVMYRSLNVIILINVPDDKELRLEAQPTVILISLFGVLFLIYQYIVLLLRVSPILAANISFFHVKALRLWQCKSSQLLSRSVRCLS